MSPSSRRRAELPGEPDAESSLLLLGEADRCIVVVSAVQGLQAWTRRHCGWARTAGLPVTGRNIVVAPLPTLPTEVPTTTAGATNALAALTALGLLAAPLSLAGGAAIGVGINRWLKKKRRRGRE